MIAEEERKNLLHGEENNIIEHKKPVSIPGYEVQLFTIVHERLDDRIKPWVIDTKKSLIKEEFIHLLSDYDLPDTTSIIAGHWGDLNKNEYLSLIKKINSTVRKIEGNRHYISYYGSRLESYHTDNINTIVQEIIEWSGIGMKIQIETCFHYYEVQMKSIEEYREALANEEEDKNVLDTIDEFINNYKILEASYDKLKDKLQ